MIAMYGLSDNLGGVEKSIIRIAENSKNAFLLIVRDEYGSADYLKKLSHDIAFVKLYRGVKGFFCNTHVFIRFFKMHPEITALHYHFMTYYNIQILIAAKIAGIKKIILHIRGGSFTRPSIKCRIMHYINKPIAQFIATDYLACSEIAKQFAYSRRVQRMKTCRVIHNGLELEKYADLSRREHMREDWNLQNKIVYGNVGAFLPVKNHELLIAIFEVIYRKNKDAYFILVGDGELRNNIEQLVHEKGMDDCCLFTGNVPNVEDYYQIMDVLILPSFSEGLPNVVLEAETNGVTCFVSDVVTKEVNIAPNVYNFSICDSPERIASFVLSNPLPVRRSNYQLMNMAKFNIKDTIELMDEVYCEQ